MRDGQNTLDQRAVCAFHSFLVDGQTKLATHVLYMRNGNLEITIAGSCCHPQVPRTVQQTASQDGSALAFIQIVTFQYSIHKTR